MKTVLAACVVAVAMATGAYAQDWSEGFEKGLGAAKTYQPNDGTTLEIGRDRPAEGKQYLRAVLPGKQALEGLNVTAPGVTGGRVATVTAKVRGKGEICLSLYSQSGWMHTSWLAVALTDQWQEISTSKTLLRTDTFLAAHFLSLKAAQPGAIYEVDDIQVKLAPLPVVYEAEVGPWRIEAEDFPMLDRYVSDDPEASGGKALQSDSYVATTDMPFPRSKQPVTVYLRVKAASEKEQWNIQTMQSGVTEYVAAVQPKKAGAWQWVAFPPRTAGEVGDSFTVCCLGDKGVGRPMSLDQVVLSTKGNLTETELAAARSWCSRRPLAVVARTDTPPALDGRGDDPCWRNAVACTGFLDMMGLKSAEADTNVRLCYDDGNLYLLITCPEPILNVARQQRGEFVAKITERDGEVYADDSVVILLDPADTGKQVFDFTVNALGTIADARCAGPDLWEGRDVKWNSGAQAKGVIGEDVWTVEMAIPFADLGGAPKPGDVWQACLGRLAKARKETTSWNPSRKGFHDPFQLGALVFGASTPGVALTMPASLQPGKNQLTASLSPLAGRPMGVFLCSSTAAASAKVRSRAYGFTDLGDKPQDFSYSFKLSQEGDLRVEYGVVNAATLEPLYLTPALTRAVKSSVAQVKLACDGPYELYLNDELVRRGAQAKGEAIAAPLRNGANVFALKLDRGTAAIRVEAPGSNFTAESWKASAADAKDATRAALDDVTWPMAAKTGDHPQLGPIVGETGKKIVLRRTLLWEKTRIWPTPEPAYYLARGPAQHMVVITDGLPGKRLDNWITYIATPPEFEVAGSSGFYGGSTANPAKFPCRQLGLQKVSGREMRVAQVAPDAPLLTRSHYIFALFDLFVRYREQAGEPKSAEAEFVYWSEANGGNVTEPPRSFKVRLLPKLAGKQPRTIHFELAGGWMDNLDDLAMREEILKCAQAAGFNQLWTIDLWTTENGPKYGIQQIFSTNHAPAEVDLADYLKEHPDQRLIDNEGQPADSTRGGHLNLMCMTALLNEGWPGVEAALKKRMGQVPAPTVLIDYEYSPYAGVNSCYCPRCLAAFREFAKLAPDTVLDAKLIRETYSAAWVDFMCRRVAQMFAKFNDAVHRISPGTKFQVYSDYQTDYCPEMYTVNWQYIAELKACDVAGCGYSTSEQDFYRTLETLKGIPMVSGMLHYPYDISATTPSAPMTTARVLRHLLGSRGGGVLLWERHGIDGRDWYAVAEVSRLAATFEDVFLKGKPVAIQGFDLSSAQIIASGGATLVCLMNQGNKAAEFAIALPADAGAGAEFYSGRKVAAGEKIKCTLQPGDVAVYVLKH